MQNFNMAQEFSINMDLNLLKVYLKLKSYMKKQLSKGMSVQKLDWKKLVRDVSHLLFRLYNNN